MIQETIKYTIKKIFKIDHELYPLGLFTILFSIGLYTAGRGDNYPIWEIWAIVHSIIAVSFSVLMAYHVHTHQTWFKIAWIDKQIGLHKIRYDIPETIITQDTLRFIYIKYNNNDKQTHTGREVGSKADDSSVLPET